MADVKGKDNFETMPHIGGTDIVPPGGSTGQILGKNSVSDYDVGWKSGGAAGGFLQYVETTIAIQTVSANINPNNAPSATDGFQIVSLKITPDSTTNKIMIGWLYFADPASDCWATTLLLRDSTIITLESGMGLMKRVYGGFMSGVFVDSPNTTSQVTYSIRCGTEISICYVNRGKEGEDYGNMSDDYSVFWLLEVQM